MAQPIFLKIKGNFDIGDGHVSVDGVPLDIILSRLNGREIILILKTVDVEDIIV